MGLKDDAFQARMATVKDDVVEYVADKITTGDNLGSAIDVLIKLRKMKVDWAKDIRSFLEGHKKAIITKLLIYVRDQLADNDLYFKANMKRILSDLRKAGFMWPELDVIEKSMKA